MNASDEDKPVNKGGRPRKPEAEKKRKVTVSLSPQTLKLLNSLHDSPSAAIEVLARLSSKSDLIPVSEARHAG